MKERILFINFNCNWSPHFETDLEIMLNKIREGADIYSLACNRVLNHLCISNQEKSDAFCESCQNRLDNGLDLIGLPLKKRFKLKPVDCPVFPSFSTVDELKSFSVDGINLGLGVASSIISTTRDHLLNPEDYREDIQTLLKNAYIVVQNVKQLVEKYHFNSIYIFNGRFAEYFCIINFCKSIQLDYYLHERGANKDKYNIIKNDIMQSRIRYQKDVENYWNKNSHDELISDKVKIWFEERRKGAEQRWLSMTAEQKKDKLPKNFDLSKYNIGIFNSSLDEFAVFDDWKSTFEDDYIVVKTLAEHYINDDHKHFYLRIHPNLKNLKTTQMNKLRELAALNLPNLTVIMPEEDIDTYALVDNCQKIMTFGSTVGVEATYFGKVSILAGVTLYDNLDCVYIADNYETLYKYLEMDLEPKPRQNCIKYVYWISSFGIPFTYFKPNGLFDGTFLGVKVKSKKYKKIERVGKRLKSRIINFFHKF